MWMTNPLSFFQWGAGGKALTPDELQKMRLLEAQRAAQGDTRPADTPAQGLARVAEALAGSVRRGQLDSQAEELAAHDQSRIESWGNTSGADTGAAVPVVAGSLMAQPANVSTGSTYEPFMQTVQQSGVSNPYALAAIAATGQAESGFSSANANRTWNDPSQSGQAGTSGGIMSWRNDRLNNLMSYAAQSGEPPGSVSPQTQAQFFLRENPQLIERLNNARSVEEAQGLMNDSWRFAGYNQPGGEADRRLQVARALLPQFHGGQPAQQQARSPMQAQGGYNSQALLDTSLDPRVSDNTRSVAQALLKQQQAQDAAAQQLQQRQAAAQSAGIDPRFAADDELWKQAAAAQFRQAPQPPASVQEYEYYRSQAAENALPYDQWDQARRRSGAQQTTINTGGEPLTPGQKKIDEAFADTYIDWTQGGSSEAQKNISQLNEAISLLSSGRNITGAVGLLPEQLQAFVNPDGTIARNNVESVVQLTLKQILGGQFAQKEGEQVLARAFNPLLPPEENARRAKRILEVISSMAASKQAMVDYFNENGTLRGFKGTRPTMGQFASLADEFGPPEERQRDNTLPERTPNNQWVDVPGGGRFMRVN